MAIKPTIYKFNIALSDLNRNYYDSLNLTLALHPSETIERMMVRVMAYCFNANERLVFTKGLSSVEEPDIWALTLDEQISLWIDVGEPAVDRVKKSRRLASRVKVYSFNTKTDVWWSQGQAKFSQLNVSIYRFNWEQIQKLASLVTRAMSISVTIIDDSAYIATESGECELVCLPLQQVEF